MQMEKLIQHDKRVAYAVNDTVEILLKRFGEGEIESYLVGLEIVEAVIKQAGALDIVENLKV